MEKMINWLTRNWRNPEKKKYIYIASVTFAIYFLFSIYAIYNTVKPTNLLRIGFRFYTEKQIESQFPGQFKKMKSDQYNQLNAIYNEFINKKLIELEAKERNTTIESLLKDKVGDYKPSDTEVLEVFTQYQNQLQGKSIEEVRASIESFLIQRKSQESADMLMAEIKGKYKGKVSYSLEEPPSVRVSVEERNNPAIGPKNAKVTVIEFSDFECPYCKRSQKETAELRNMYKDRIRWVFRDYPLPFHENAMFAHKAVNCAIPQNKYWEYFSVLFDNSGDLGRENVIFLAEKAGLDKGKLMDCLKNDSALEQEIQMDIAEGKSLGVNGTPAFFINGILLEGAQPLDAFKKIIDKELNN